MLFGRTETHEYSATRDGNTDPSLWRPWWQKSTTFSKEAMDEATA
jgi:hypothetical protein